MSSSDARWLYRVSGASALLIAIGYVLIIGLYVPIGVPPAAIERRLTWVAANTTRWWIILGLSVLTDVLFLPVSFALYTALKGIGRSAMVLACACVCLFVFLDLPLTWMNYAALINLSHQYVNAASEVLRAAVVTAAMGPCAVLDSPLLFVYNSLTLAIGLLIMGVVMRKGIFRKATAYLAVAIGVCGIVAVLGPFILKALGPTIILVSLLTTAWSAFVAFDLLRLARQ